MVKMIKRKRKVRVDNLIIMIFIISFLAYLTSVTILRSQNVALATSENHLQLSIEKLENDVANLELEVKQLDNRERILEICEKQGLKVNQENIVSVASNDVVE